MPEKPKNLIYGVDDKPPLLTNLFLGLQHYWIISISFVLPIILVREIGGDYRMQQHVLSMSMLAGAVGVIAQSLKKGPVGSGYLLPAVNSPSYMAASLMAVHAGGLPLLFGMTLTAGVFEASLSRILNRLKKLFPPEVTGLIVTMVGISVIEIASKNFLSLGNQNSIPDYQEIFAAILTLCVMVGFNIWTKGNFKLFSVLIGIVFGYLFCASIGLIDRSHLETFNETKIFDYRLHHPGWSFQWSMLLPFLIASVCSSVKSIGDIMTCQKINDANWKRTDMENVRGGILADAIGSIAAGFLGGMGQSTSSSNIGLSISNGATSRKIAYGIAAIMVVTAFFPKFAFIFTAMPKPVVGATLYFAVSFMILTGIQIMVSRMMDVRKLFVIGISMIVGISMDVLPDSYVDSMHPLLHPLFSNSLTSATVVAVALNLVLRIGISQKYSLKLNPAKDTCEKILEFMEETGAKTAALKEFVNRATHTMDEIFIALKGINIKGDVLYAVKYTDVSIIIEVIYEGDPLHEIATLPEITSTVEKPERKADIAVFLAEKFSDSFSFIEKNGKNIIKFKIES